MITVIISLSVDALTAHIIDIFNCIFKFVIISCPQVRTDQTQAASHIKIIKNLDFYFY